LREQSQIDLNGKSHCWYVRLDAVEQKTPPARLMSEALVRKNHTCPLSLRELRPSPEVTSARMLALRKQDSDNMP
jgi:hypothetical protein